MYDLDFITTKNQLEILILKVQKKYDGQAIPERMKELLRTLYMSLSLIIQQDNINESLKKEIISLKLQSVRSYKDIAILKRKLKL